MKTIDLKRFGKRDVSFYLALELFILNQKLDDDVFFLWDLNKSIVIGKHQILEAEVNIDYANKIDAKIFRRHSGGGAIYADEGCFMYSFITKQKNRNDVYRYLKNIKDCLKELGIDSYYSGRNDLMYLSKKFSGTAIYQNSNGTVLHGTFLYNTDIENLVKCITPNNEKLISKGIKSVRERVINLKDYLNISQEQLMDYLLHNIGDKVVCLSDEDYITICGIENENLKSNKYQLISSNIPYQYINKKRFEWGEIQVSIDCINNITKQLAINGDFFSISDLDEFVNCFKNIIFRKEEYLKVLNNNNINKYIISASNNDFIDLIFSE